MARWRFPFPGLVVVLALVAASTARCDEPSEITPIVRKGRDQLAHRDYVGAAKTFERAARAAPKDGEINLLYGLALYGCDRAEEAIPPLKISVEQMPKDAIAMQFLGRAYDRVDRLDEAAAMLERARELDPTDPATVNQLGAVRMKQGDSDRALEHFEAALSLDPDYGAAHYNAGVLFLLRGASAKAEEHMIRAFELSQEDSDAPLILGDLCAQGGRDVDARDWYEIAAERMPGSDFAIERAALSNIAVHDLASAWHWQRVRMEGDPQNAEVWRATKNLAIVRGDLLAAGNALDRCVSITGDVTDLRELANLLEDRGDLQGARKRIEQILSKTPTDLALRARLSRICESLGDRQTARAEFEQLVKEGDGDLVGLRCVAQRMIDSSVEGIGNAELGRKIVAALVEKSAGRDPASLVLLAEAEATTGHPTESAANYARAAALFDEDAPAARLLRERAAQVKGDVAKDR